MTTQRFDAPVIANAKLGDPALDLAIITGASYRHDNGKGIGETMLTLQIGRINIQCADPNWFRHLIDQANTALTSAGYPPHHTASNDDAPEQEKGAA